MSSSLKLVYVFPLLPLPGEVPYLEQLITISETQLNTSKRRLCGPGNLGIKAVVQALLDPATDNANWVIYLHGSAWLVFILRLWWQGGHWPSPSQHCPHSLLSQGNSVFLSNCGENPGGGPHAHPVLSQSLCSGGGDILIG